MSVLSSNTIWLAGIFEPFCFRTKHPETMMTYGCGPASYDVRLGQTIKLQPGIMTLASTIERFTMPDHVCGVVHDKSSLARIGVVVQNTFIDPGWRGFLTLEISYHHLNDKGGKDTSLTLKQGTPIAQIVLHYLDETTNQPYTGVYQDQMEGPQPSHYIPTHDEPNKGE